jgi:hypothetical protein
MERPDIAAICSAAAMAQRSRDPGHTKGWRREAWPVPVDAHTVLIHCLAGSSDGETRTRCSARVVMVRVIWQAGKTSVRSFV